MEAQPTLVEWFVALPTPQDRLHTSCGHCVKLDATLHPCISYPRVLPRSISRVYRVVQLNLPQIVGVVERMHIREQTLRCRPAGPHFPLCQHLSGVNRKLFGENSYPIKILYFRIYRSFRKAGLIYKTRISQSRIARRAVHFVDALPSMIQLQESANSQNQNPHYDQILSSRSQTQASTWVRVPDYIPVLVVTN